MLLVNITVCPFCAANLAGKEGLIVLVRNQTSQQELQCNRISITITVVGCHRGGDFKESSFPNEFQANNPMKQIFLSPCSVPGTVQVPRTQTTRR